MTDDSCKPSRSAGSVPRACTPFSPPPPTSSVPVVAPPVFVPVAPVMPVMTVSGAAPDRFGNVDIRPFVSGKADKAVPSASGNLASLTAQGNLVDSGASPSDFAPASHASDGSIHHTASEIGQIAAGEVAKVVANAPGTMDTLKEIADILGSAQQSGTVLKRVSDLESGKVDQVPGKGLSENDYTDADKAKLGGLSPQVQADYGQTNTTAPDFIKNKPTLAAVATSGSYGDLSGRPTIPAPVAVDATLTAQGAAADAKAVGDALRSGFTEWEFGGLPAGVSVESISYVEPSWSVFLSDGSGGAWELPQTALLLDGAEAGGVYGAETLPSGFTATRHLVTPTKTSQLTNDGDGTNAFVKTNDSRLADARAPTAHVHAVSDVTGLGAALAGKADKAVPAAAGNLAALDAQGNLADSGAKPSDFAPLSDLPYALVTPGEWSFSGLPSGVTDVSLSWDGTVWSYAYVIGTYTYNNVILRPITEPPYDGNELSLTFTIESSTVTATRPSLPGHLLDRAVNAVPVSSATGITLPNKIAGGKSRDFYVRLTVSAESAVTFAATDSGGNAVAWDSMGNPSATLAAGTYLYRLTEVADGVFHAADITDGGSIDPAVLDEKLDASSAAPPFSDSRTYLVGEYVTYGGVLYRCKTAVTTAGSWTGTSNWESDDMTSPDATLDIMSDGRLRVVTVAGEDLWMQGYDLESTSAQVLKCEKVNLLSFSATTASAFDSTAAYAVGDTVVYGGMVYKFTAAHSAGDWIGTDAAVDSVSLTMPYVPVGKVGDFVLDVDNSANASVKMVAELSGLFTAFDVFVDKGRNLSDLLTFDGGEQCELYFTMTAFGTQAKPAWKVVKQVVEKQEAGS